MASRVFAPKMASVVAQSTLKATRPALRASFKPQQVQQSTRTFASKHQLHRPRTSRKYLTLSKA